MRDPTLGIRIGGPESGITPKSKLLQRHLTYERVQYSPSSPTLTAAPVTSHVFDPELESVLFQLPPLSEDRLYPKEQALIDLVAKERLT